MYFVYKNMLLAMKKQTNCLKLYSF